MSVVSFGAFELRKDSRQLLKDGERVALGARAFDMLVCLVEHHTRIVTRAELMNVVWPDTVVGDNNLNVQIGNLRRALPDGAVVTVPGQGFRFALDVVFQSHVPVMRTGPTAKPSVAVLPFANLSGAEKSDWLADGVVEDITTEISRFNDLAVVGRNSAQVYRAVPRDVRSVAQQLGVRYLIEGSVRVAGQRIRVGAQLIDALDGAQIWAETFDSQLEDIFDTQHQIAQAIVTSLVPQIDKAEVARIRLVPPGDLSAYELARRGWGIVSAGDMVYDPGPRNQATDAARAALEIDPWSGMAWRVIAWVEWWHAYHATTDALTRTLAKGIDAADRAIAIDSSDHHARRLKGLLLFQRNEPEDGLAELRRAVDINPNCAITLAWTGMFETFHGDDSKGLPLSERAVRLSPKDPSLGSMMTTLGFARFAGRDYAGAVDCARNALAERAAGASPLVLAAISYVGANDLEKAYKSFDTLQETAPKLVEARLAGRWLATNHDYIKRADMFFRVAARLEAPDAVQKVQARR